MSTEIRFTGDVSKLEPGRPVEKALRGGEGHRYEASFAAGQYVQLAADQRGIDLLLLLRAPDGREIAKIDSPSGRQGPEQLFEVIDTPGLYRLEIFSEEASNHEGRYEIRLDPPRPAGEEDRRHVQAFRLFQEGEVLRRQEEAVAAGQAVEKYREALALWREFGRQEWEGQSLQRTAMIQQLQLEDMDEALATWREALPLFQALGQRDQEGIALNHLGLIELHYGRLQEAIDLHLQAIAIFQDLGETGPEAVAQNNLGGVYSVAGEAQKGLEAYRQGLERAQATDRPDEEASSLRGIGEILLGQGKLAPALDSLRQSLAAYRRTGSPREAALVLSRMAAISQRRGRLDDALSQLQESLALVQQTGYKDIEVLNLNSLGTLHLLRKETAQAGEAYTRALTLAKSTDNRYGEAFALLNLARYQFDEGHPREALRLHDEAAALFQEIGSRRGEVSTLYGSARALHALGDYEAARQRLEKVVDGVESLRAGSENQDLRSSYFATKQHYFELYIDVLMHLDDAAGALALNERRRARSLLETIAEMRAGGRKTEANPDLLAQRKKLQERINAGEARLQRTRGAADEAALERIEEKLRALLLELGDVEARIRGRNLEASPPLTVAEMSRLLGPSNVLLVYSLGEERSFLWFLTGNGKLSSYELPPRERLEEAANQVRSAWSRRGGDRGSGARAAAQLSKDILEPVAAQLENRRLIIIGDGALEALPFAALPDPRALSGNPAADQAAAPLLVRNEVVHLPSLSTLATLRHKKRLAPPPSWLAIVADPVFSPDDPRVRPTPSSRPAGSTNGNLTRAAEDLGIDRFERLPFTRVEAESIARLVPNSNRVILDFAASREILEGDELKRYRILHFATHGLLNSRHPELSGLVLSRVNPQGNLRDDDGFLLAHEISTLDLRAQLVVLSACQTGLGDQIRGEGLVSLTRSFLQAGTPRIIVSLWNVNDRATAELMIRFYRTLIEKGLPPSSALRCAQLSMRRQTEWSDPVFWAPFIFQGEWQTGNHSDGPPIEVKGGSSRGPAVPDDDFPPPGSDVPPPCPELDR
ncbi:MAG TPA: CHAT domain-containing protein [Thermoanaerobaculia bacterium]|nr:CHAT domain-containing protein [Thermoanaerobaculia bacterium]